MLTPADGGTQVHWNAEVKSLGGLLKAIPSVRILNMVPWDESHGEEGTNAKLRREQDDLRAGRPSNYDVILTCYKVREGTDWTKCSDLHVTYPEGSLSLAIQTVGRLLRPYTGKKRISANYYFPEFPEPRRGMTKEELLDGRKNCLLLMLQLQEGWFPLLFPEVPDEPIRRGRHRQRTEKPKTFRDLLGDEGLADMRRTFITDCLAQQASGGDFNEAYDGIVDRSVAEAGVPEEFREDAKRYLQAVYLRAADMLRFRVYTIDFVREAGFERLLNDLGTGLWSFMHAPVKMRELNKIFHDFVASELTRIQKAAAKLGDVTLLPQEDQSFLREQLRYIRKCGETRAKGAGA